MGKLSNVVATILVAVQILILPAVSPAVAISVELAKKCREMAIKAHPPPPKDPRPMRRPKGLFQPVRCSKRPNGGHQPARGFTFP